MNRNVVWLLCCCASVLHAQQPPPFLRDAGHCLVQHWLDPDDAQPHVLRVSYFLDTKSWLGEKVLYVAVYKSPARTAGLVFLVTVEQKGKSRSLILGNNARFRVEKDGIGFVGD